MSPCAAGPRTSANLSTTSFTKAAVPLLTASASIRVATAKVSHLASWTTVGRGTFLDRSSFGSVAGTFISESEPGLEYTSRHDVSVAQWKKLWNTSCFIARRKRWRLAGKSDQCSYRHVLIFSNAAPDMFRFVNAASSKQSVECRICVSGFNIDGRTRSTTTPSGCAERGASSWRNRSITGIDKFARFAHAARDLMTILPSRPVRCAGLKPPWECKSRAAPTTRPLRSHGERRQGIDANAFTNMSEARSPTTSFIASVPVAPIGPAFLLYLSRFTKPSSGFLLRDPRTRGGGARSNLDEQHAC